MQEICERIFALTFPVSEHISTDVIIDKRVVSCYTEQKQLLEVYHMTHIQTLDTRDLCQSAKNGGCGECQTSCQSACKTSCGIANQNCENK